MSFHVLSLLHRRFAHKSWVLKQALAAFGHNFIFSGFLGTDDIGLSNALAFHSFSAVQKPSFYRHTPKRYLLSEARSAVGYGHPDIPDVQAWI